ncbi:IS66 family insertion sequence element accessory protein TnpB [Vibrio sp. SCSIO 43133]|nr:IS66 family insertion sequence element accessory protein TnpB [Vibrio sp. SCSIO 43133]
MHRWLAYLAEQTITLDPFQSVLFALCNKFNYKVKALYRNRTGFALWYKRLGRDRFYWWTKGTKTIF